MSKETTRTTATSRSSSRRFTDNRNTSEHHKTLNPAANDGGSNMNFVGLPSVNHSSNRGTTHWNGRHSASSHHGHADSSHYQPTYLKNDSRPRRSDKDQRTSSYQHYTSNGSGGNLLEFERRNQPINQHYAMHSAGLPNFSNDYFPNSSNDSFFQTSHYETRPNGFHAQGRPDSPQRISRWSDDSNQGLNHRNAFSDGPFPNFSSDAYDRQRGNNEWKRNDHRSWNSSSRSNGKRSFSPEGVFANQSINDRGRVGHANQSINDRDRVDHTDRSRAAHRDEVDGRGRDSGNSNGTRGGLWRADGDQFDCNGARRNFSKSDGGADQSINRRRPNEYRCIESLPWSQQQRSHLSSGRRFPNSSEISEEGSQRNGRRGQQDSDSVTQSRIGRSMLPEGWLEFTRTGKVIEGTRIMCLKTPVDPVRLYRNDPNVEQWTVDHFFEDMARTGVKVGMLVDLTNTPKYYQGHAVAAKRKIKFLKIMIPGKAIPSELHYIQFRNDVDTFLANSPPDENVAVHCTHGVNRTGWFVCRYLMESLGMSFADARRRFVAARGHDIYRDYLIQDLEKRDSQAVLAKAGRGLPVQV
ncbi:putative tyrosine-protein phosphatase 1 [Hypsibius exemplaris]|uniref:Tyrosine-protein phosphatase 1 n=1 Tax=Hypsibius exemplaris TaxID=2072580 RepID=A0A9X6NIL5_HYPEX|nr:putative tyrosine-protein phosphatase 1 [Hypsibius exemplaris]